MKDKELKSCNSSLLRGVCVRERACVAVEWAEFTALIAAFILHSQPGHAEARGRVLNICTASTQAPYVGHGVMHSALDMSARCTPSGRVWDAASV